MQIFECELTLKTLQNFSLDSNHIDLITVYVCA